MRAHRASLLLFLFAMTGGAVLVPPPAMARAQSAAAPADARIWIGHAQEIEDFLRTVDIVKIDDLSVGVTKPKKATLPPGGPVPYLVWKDIPPGPYGGAIESYKAEIAAYELDKFLGLNMVPPTVEKLYNGRRGAAVMWASPSKSFKDFGGTGAPTAPAVYADAFGRQLVKAKMFDNLIENLDPNLGNWLVDPAWHLMLIDHSRCFTSAKDMVHVMTYIEPELWKRMQALTEASLQAPLGKWVAAPEIRAIIQRRDKMQQIVDKLVKDKGEAVVFMRTGSGG